MALIAYSQAKRTAGQSFCSQEIEVLNSAAECDNTSFQ